MGHEVSHALAGHGNERISQAMIAQGLGAASGAAIKMINYNKFSSCLSYRSSRSYA
jgi:hypothetical protein